MWLLFLFNSGGSEEQVREAVCCICTDPKNIKQRQQTIKSGLGRVCMGKEERLCVFLESLSTYVFIVP